MSLLLALACAVQTPAPIDLPRLLEELTDRGSLARLPDPPLSRERHAFRARRLARDEAERAAKLEAYE